MELTPENEARLDEILKRYPVKRSALLPALRLVQQQEGWISREAIEHVARLLELSPAQVHDAASFYSMFRLQPEGKRLIEICTTLSCALGGAEKLLEHTCKRLGVEPGGTSADGEFTVRGVECLAACGGAPAVQVDGEWLEHATPADIDRVIAGETVRRSFEWPKSPGEHVLFQNVWKEGSTSLDVYRQGGGYAKLGEWLRMTPESIVEEVKKSNLRGRGGAGFPTGMKWSFLPKDNPKPRYLCVNADESEPGTYKDRVILERDPHRLIEAVVVSCHAIRAQTAYVYIRGEFHEGARDPGGGARRGARGRIRRREHPRQRHERRDPRPPRRGLLRVRRGDGAPQLARGPARPAADPAALPGGRGPLRLPDDRQQRRDARERAADPGARRVLVRELRDGEERRAEALLGERPREAARQLRSADGEADAARARLRRGLRPGDPRRPQAEGRRPGRLVDPGADRRRDRRGDGLRLARQGRLDARLGRHDRDGRLDLHGLDGEEPDVLLQARVLRQVHALPRGHGLDAAAARAHRGGRRRRSRTSSCSGR